MKKINIFLILIFTLNSFSMVIDNLDDIRGDWVSISDQVMGGISEGGLFEIQEDGKNFYRLEGVVSTANNGGFLQAQVRNKNSSQVYKGLKLTVRGTNDNYYVWIRTPQCRFPWDRYLVSFLPTSDWQTIYIPFEDFKKSNVYMRKKMNLKQIRTIALAAYGKDFNAQLDIANIEFY